jgi:3-oxoacyl-[acyl-carrier-protein] synthase-3
MPDVLTAAERPAAGVRTVRGCGIAGLGGALPERRMPNTAIGGRLGVEPQWIAQRTGVEERRYLSPGETLTQLATAAGADALASAGVEGADLDLVLVSTCTSDQLLPHTSSLVAGELGAVRAGAMDIGAACMGFLSAVALGASYVETARADRVLVIGADQFSRFIDPDDRQTVSVLGDGAGAVLLAPATGSTHIGPFVMRADHAGAELVYMTRERPKLHMDGPETFKWAVAVLAEATDQAIEAAGLERDDIDLFVYHQANGRVLRSVGQKLGLPADRVVNCIAGTGNTSSASIPLALGVAYREERLEPGSRILVSAIGAGFVWGAGVIEWRPDEIV